AKAGKGLLEGTLQAGTSAVSDKLLDLVGLGGKSAADKGKDTRDYLRKFDLSLRSSRSSYFATFRHQLTILSKTDALDEEKWLNMLGTFVKDWFRYESHFVHGRDSLVDILKERGLLSESDAVQPLIGKKS